MNVSPKKVCKSALKLDPDAILVITEGPSGHIDVFSSDGKAEDMLKRAKKHLKTLSA